MPVQLCPRCHRANPQEATYCHFDGWELRARSGVSAGSGNMGREFVFPSGTRCKTFDDLVRSCTREWSAARTVLRHGGLRQFFAGIGRMDLAYAAEKAASQTDLDIGLDQLLAQLPVRDVVGPRLDLVPRRISLGKLKVGDTRQIQLTIVNQGSRLLHGTLQIEGDDWLSLAGTEERSMRIKTGRQQVVTLSVDSFGLVAGQRYRAKLILITNGGVVEVPVTMELIPQPFQFPPLQGATSPKDLALRMRDREVARRAGALLENGSVQRWFAANGWRYPVQGPSARGIAAVQQFFEGMGVSKPPPLTLSDHQAWFICRKGQTARGRVVLYTTARKWVYGRVESDEPWLVPVQPDVGGPQQATIEFEVFTDNLAPNQIHQANLKILANSGQRLTFGVRLEVQPMRYRRSRQLARAMTLGGLAGGAIRIASSLPDVSAANRAFGTWVHQAPPEFLDDYVRQFTLYFGWLGIPIMLVLLGRRARPIDWPAGLLIGGVTGMAVAATTACAVPIIDGWLAQLLPIAVPGIAIVAWTAAGMVLFSFLSLLGALGRRVVDAVGRMAAWVAARIGLPTVAEFLAGSA